MPDNRRLRMKFDVVLTDGKFRLGTIRRSNNGPQSMPGSRAISNMRCDPNMVKFCDRQFENSFPI